jgi:hypothetical protein
MYALLWKHTSRLNYQIGGSAPTDKTETVCVAETHRRNTAQISALMATLRCASRILDTACKLATQYSFQNLTYALPMIKFLIYATLK